MGSSLEDYEEILRRRNDELQARAQASVAAADAAIRERDTQEAFSQMDLSSLVQQNIHSVLQEMEDAPEMGIRDSIDDGSDEAGTQPAALMTETRGPERPAAAVAAQPAPGGRQPSGTGSRRTSEPPQQQEEPSELDVPGNVPASVRLHKAKIRALEQEVAALRSTVKDKDKKLTSSQQQSKELQTEKLKWQKERKNLESEVAKTKRNYDSVKTDLAQKENAIRDLSSNLDRAECENSANASGAVKEKRSSETDQRAREVRLNRALEEVEKYKQLLEEVKANDRDGKQVAKSDYNRVVSENKKLERQRQELIVAFKKQMKLIDVLRRQKLHMEAARQIAFTEEEFLKTLDIQT